MSVYSGKCDVFDSIIMIGGEDKTDEEINDMIARSTFRITTKDGKNHKLDIKNMHDLMPYYPYLTSIGSGYRDENNQYCYSIVFSSMSFVDMEERQMLSSVLNDILKLWRKCKREKTIFTKEYVIEKIYWSNSSYFSKIVDLVIENKGKTTLDDIIDNHISTSMHDWMRTRLYRDMVADGYNEAEAYNWCFGYFWSEDRSRLCDE